MRTVSPIHEEDEEKDEAELDLILMLINHPLLDAMSVSTYRTATHTAEEPVKVDDHDNEYCQQGSHSADLGTV